MLRFLGWALLFFPERLARFDYFGMVGSAWLSVACLSGMNEFPFSSALAVGVGANADSALGPASATVACAMPRLAVLLEACVEADPEALFVRRLSRPPLSVVPLVSRPMPMQLCWLVRPMD